jgi:hypothetical protein
MFIAQSGQILSCSCILFVQRDSIILESQLADKHFASPKHSTQLATLVIFHHPIQMFSLQADSNAFNSLICYFVHVNYINCLSQELRVALKWHL